MSNPNLRQWKPKNDPLALHIFVSCRHYRNVNDTKRGKRREMTARVSFDTTCALGFRGSLDEWQRLMGAVTMRWTDDAVWKQCKHSAYNQFQLRFFRWLQHDCRAELGQDEKSSVYRFCACSRSGLSLRFRPKSMSADYYAFRRVSRAGSLSNLSHRGKTEDFLYENTHRDSGSVRCDTN